jgi:monothiol glutaredoxin
MTDINAFIDEKVKNNDVFLFLNYLGVEFDSANVLESPELRDGIKAYSNWPTIPQLYVKGEFVGGADITREMFQSGELQTQFQQAGIAVKQSA